jgi:GntR family transcriptional regulator
LSDGYYLAALAAGTALQLPDQLGGAASDYIEKELGRLITRFVEDLSARAPTAAEARTLHMRPRGPIVRTLRTAYDGDDKPLEVLDSRQPADRHTWRYEIPVPAPGSE